MLPGGQPPPLLAELRDAVEVDFRPAPGGRGTELHARLARHPSSPPDGGLTQDDLRVALTTRWSKSPWRRPAARTCPARRLRAGHARR
ncbi:MAG TPA: hypothetical protein VEQ66_15900 [Propionibacteriaceae bacterium]|nr:hypothetical protein [Propionibacteriaceae bacterium]